MGSSQGRRDLGGVKVIKVTEVLIGNLLAVGTNIQYHQLSYEPESADVEFIENQLLQPKRLSQDETSETEMSWRLLDIQQSDVGTSPAISCGNEILDSKFRKPKAKFHYLNLGRFHKTSLLKAK